MFDHILRELPRLSHLDVQELGGWTLFIDMILSSILFMYWEQAAKVGHAKQAAIAKKRRK